MPKAIIVLGMHRSGTSLLAEAVCRWGAYAGRAKDLIEAGRANPRGFWEFEPLVSFNNLLLASLDADWCLPPPEGTEALMELRASEQWFKKRASYLISRMEAAGRPWFWKDPRLCILLPFWKKHLDATYVITIRKPTEVALSLFKRNGMPTSAALLLWQYYMLSLLKNVHDVQSKIFVEYDALASGSDEEFRRLSAFLDANCGGSSDPAGRLKNMMSVATPELNHNGPEASTAHCQLTREQQKLQEVLERSLSNCQAGTYPEGCDLYPGWREYLEVCYTLRAISRML